MTKFSFFSKLVLASVLTFSVVSCDKDEDPSSLTVDLLKKGTIQGYVYAELDLTTEGKEKAPAGTQLILTVDYSELGSIASGSWSDTVAVGEDGTFVAQIPVTTEGASVEITPLPYSYEQVQEYGSYFSTIAKLYEEEPITVSVKENGLEVVQISYDDDYFDDFVDMIELKGVLVANFDSETSDEVNCTSGINITFYGDEWSKTVSTGANGIFSVVLPKGKDVYVDCKFSAQKSVYNSGSYSNVLYTYTIDGESLNSFGSSQTDYELSAGRGEEAE